MILKLLLDFFLSLSGNCDADLFELGSHNPGQEKERKKEKKRKKERKNERSRGRKDGIKEIWWNWVLGGTTGLEGH